jgi:hypothetical protein
MQLKNRYAENVGDAESSAIPAFLEGLNGELTEENL